MTAGGIWSDSYLVTQLILYALCFNALRHDRSKKCVQLSVNLQSLHLWLSKVGLTARPSPVVGRLLLLLFIISLLLLIAICCTRISMHRVRRSTGRTTYSCLCVGKFAPSKKIR
jgi:hypothetical protein